MFDNYRKALIESFRKAKNRLILLDYDGTLVDYEIIPDNARISDHLSEILKLISHKENTEVYIISGRAHEDIDKHLNHLPVKIISEHGSMIKNGNEWITIIPENHLWKESVLPLMNRAVSDCHGSFIEEKRYSLAWHYRKSHPQDGVIYSGRLIRNLEEFIRPFGLKILNGKKVVEIMPEESGKGKAVKRLIERKSYDFILSVGDDATDEEMFEYLSSVANTFTIKVGNGNSFARYKIKNITGVIKILEILSE